MSGLSAQDIRELTHDYIIVHKAPQFSDREYFYSGNEAAPWIVDIAKAYCASMQAMADIAHHLELGLPFGFTEIREVRR